MLILTIRVNIVKALAKREVNRNLFITIDSFFIEAVAYLLKNELITLFDLL